MNIKRNTAVIVAAATVGALGIGGLVAANADSGTSPNHSRVTTHTEKSDGDGEVPDSQEGSDGETNDDATDTGPDANPNEPGHQDASDNQGDTEEPDGAGEVPDSQEQGE